MTFLDTYVGSGNPPNLKGLTQAKCFLCKNVPTSTTTFSTSPSSTGNDFILSLSQHGMYSNASNTYANAPVMESVTCNASWCGYLSASDTLCVGYSTMRNVSGGNGVVKVMESHGNANGVSEETHMNYIVGHKID